MEVKNLKIDGIKDSEYKELIEHFIDDAPASFGKNHYVLAKETGVKPEIWSKILNNPKIQTFIKTEQAIIQRSDVRRAKLDLGDARSNIDVQKAKQLVSMEAADDISKSKPFNLYAFPKELKMMIDALKRIKNLSTNKDILAIIAEVLPNA